MKFLITLGAIFTALGTSLLPVHAELRIYDDFTSGLPLSPPNPDLWTVTGASNGARQTGGILDLYDAQMISKEGFGYGSFIFTFFQSDNTSYLGFGLGTAGGDRILLRDDFVAGGGLRLDVFTNGIAVVDPVAATESYELGSDDIWEFQYAPDHLTLLQNGVTVFSQALTLTEAPVRITLFTYSGGDINLDHIKVSADAIPEPSVFVLLAGGIAFGFGMFRRQKRFRAYRPSLKAERGAVG